MLYLKQTNEIYKYILCLFVQTNEIYILFVGLYPINVKTAEPIGPKLVVASHKTPGKFIDGHNLKNLQQKRFNFRLIWKLNEKFLVI